MTVEINLAAAAVEQASLQMIAETDKADGILARPAKILRPFFPAAATFLCCAQELIYDNRIT